MGVEYERIFTEGEKVEASIREAELHSSEAFTLCRSQILLASNRKQRPKVSAQNLDCATQTVRKAIHAFEQKGVDCLKQEPSRPKTVQALLPRGRKSARMDQSERPDAGKLLLTDRERGMP